jgi:hypothetical protein
MITPTPPSCATIDAVNSQRFSSVLYISTVLRFETPSNIWTKQVSDNRMRA